MKAHIKSKHKGEYLYSCEKEGNKTDGKICKYKTNGKSEFKDHCLKNHSDTVPEKKYSCSKCSKKFISKLQLRKHNQHGMCDILKNFICEDCDPPRGFKKMISLQTHQNVFHTNTIAKFDCPQCQKKFGSKNSLKNHLKWHYSIKLLERAQTLRRKNEEMLKKKATEARKASTRMLHKSAPAKLLRSMRR